MRILSISGQNIASLAEPFLIDLTAEPLRSAGLFAITGETGAGKSSILDAMCLALYGDAPRLSSGSVQDEVPDAAGEPIKARDPRAMLRHGAVQGWAKVRFVAIDGQEYEAQWSARRARDKAEGRLQAVARQVARVADGQVLASQSLLVAERIQALTGLSYDEFRRTVLLAQGDFDAFLRADDTARAALLEKVTGTQLYRAISARVFDRTATAMAALTALTLQRDAHQLLSDDALAALAKDRAALILAIDSGRTQRQVLDADLARHARHATAQTRLAEADQALKRTLDLRDAAGTDRTRLATIDRAEPLRLPYEAARQAEANRDAAAKTLADAETALSGAAAKAQDQRHLAQQATLAHDAKEAEFKTFGPIWSEATRLDTGIRTATVEAESASGAAQSAALAAMAAQAAALGLKTRSDGTRAELDHAKSRLAELAPLAPLSAHWGQVDRDLTDHASALVTRHTAVDRLGTLSGTTSTIKATQAQLASADAADRAAREMVGAEIATCAARIADLDAGQPQLSLTRLTDLGTCLTALDHAAQAHAAAVTAHSDAARTLAAETQAHQAALLGCSEAQDLLLRAEVAMQALTAPVEQANLAASDAARHLRLRLVPGAPCPVCGAAEHPTLADAALTELAANLRQALDEAKAKAQSAATALTQAQGKAAGAVARADQARLTLTAQAKHMDAAQSLWRKGLEQARAYPLCPALPEAPDDAAALSEARNQTETARTAALATLEAVAALRTAKDRAEQQQATLSARIEDRTTTAQDHARTLADLAQEQALCQQMVASADLRLADLAAQLEPYLAAAGETVAALADPNPLRLRLHAKANSHAAALAAMAELTTTLTDLQPQLATAQAQAQDTDRFARDTAETAAIRKAALHSLTLSRAPLLNGQPTEAHRTAFNHSRLAAQEARTLADAAQAQAFAGESLAKGSRDAAAEALARADSAVEDAHDRLLRALSGSDIAADMLAAVFALPHAQVESLRQSLRALDDAVTAAEAAHSARQTDLLHAMAAGLPDRSAEILMADVAALDAGQASRQESIGAINTRLASDKATRISLSDLQAQIDAAKAQADIWAAVNDAIGSRNGDAFARIAQSITLDQLVDHANHHLADLKPRYRLRRAANLALQVEDLDMGAEARATRSLSGGERFLISLALALALSRMGDKGGLAATLFIDEGFGSLDAESLDVAIDALETLQSQGRMIGVISHVEAMKDRIPAQIRVRRQGGGKSAISITGPQGL